MLQSHIIHLKNIVIFKIIFFLLAVVLLAWQLPLSYDHLSGAQTTQEAAREELLNVKQKIQYMSDYKNIIDSTYQAYTAKLQHPTSSCLITERLTAQYNNLAETFRLKSDPILTSSPTPLITPYQNSHALEIFGIVYDLSFQAQGFKHALSFIKEAYQLLPSYGMIYALKISETEVITPDSIAKLSIGQVPYLIEGKVGLQVREVRAVRN
ncbi:MAG: hypothetical protein V4485_00850 [Pseudomonadota bacterium]